MQSDLKSIISTSQMKNVFKTVSLNLMSNNSVLIKEQIINDLISMINKSYILIGIIDKGDNNYLMVFEYSELKFPNYEIEIFESNYKTLTQQEIENIFDKKVNLKNNGVNKRLVCLMKNINETKIGTTFFFIFEVESQKNDDLNSIMNFNNKNVKEKKDLYHVVNVVCLTSFIILMPLLQQEFNLTVLPLALSLLLTSIGHLYIYNKKHS